MSTTLSGATTTEPKVLADLLPKSLLIDTALIVGAAGLVGALAQLSVPFTPVPMTGQTFGVLLAGTVLGWRRGSIAMALYLLVGLAGVPWFAGQSSGYVGASFGYIVGFVVAGGVAGWLASRGNDRHLLQAYASMAVAEAIIYAFGLTWLKVDLHVSWSQAIAYGFPPFILGDLLKAALAGLVLPGAWQLASRTSPNS